jgi:hypothetical protein
MCFKTIRKLVLKYAMYSGMYPRIRRDCTVFQNVENTVPCTYDCKIFNYFGFLSSGKCEERILHFELRHTNIVILLFSNNDTLTI